MQHITATPLPRWKDLIFSLFGKTYTDDNLGKSWCRPGETAFWFSRSSWSLAYLSECRKLLTRQENINVWLPDYFCNSALVHLRETGINPIFYPLDRNMTPDFSACQQLIELYNPDIFVLVHFFGQPADTIQSAQLCEARNAWLVEDATHVLLPVQGVGEYGDAVMYSPHKHLPIYDGAVLILRPDGPSALPITSFPAEVRSSILISAKPNGIGIIKWLLKRTIQKIGVRRSTFPDTFASDLDLSSKATLPADMTAFSRRLLSRITTDMDTIAMIRRERYADWQTVLKSLGLPEITPINGICPTPYIAALQCPDIESTKSLFSTFLKAGIPVTTWPDLPPEILSCPENHLVALDFRRIRIYLPVHQSITRKQIVHASQNLRRQLAHKDDIPLQPKLLEYAEWSALWEKCSKTNLMQSWQYGAAKEEAEGWRAIRLQIVGSRSKSVALVQVLLRSYPVIGSIARINRGPILLNENTDELLAQKLDIIEALLVFAKKQKWRVIQIAPEISAIAGAEVLLKTMGLNKLSQAPWGSAMLSLYTEEDDLLMQLKGKWRNGMRKGLKHGVSVSHSVGDGKDLELLLDSYKSLQKAREFKGLSEAVIRALARQKGDEWQFNLFIGRDNAQESELLGTLVTIRSGDTVTYCIGTTTNTGKKIQINSVLLWEAILQAKAEGCEWFDVGGLNAETPSGIANFKSGLNATPYTLIGEFRGWMHNFLRLNP